MKSVFASAVVATAMAAIPEQIHLSVTGKVGEMAVDFVSAASGTQSVNISGFPLIAADCQQATLNNYKAFFCTAVMAGLAPATTYTYTIGSAATGWTAAYNFTNAPNARPLVFAVYADFGIGNDESLKALVKDSAAGGFDYVIHAGDWAYDLDGANSATGNAFMNSLQPYSASVPYMGVPGNHEAYGTQGGGAFQQFVLRNRALAQGVGSTSGSNSNIFYSFDTPFTHWIGFTGETWTMSAAQLATQMAWIEADLSKVDRTVTPWVIAFSHKAFQMDQTTWSLYDFLATYKVDVQFVGHWHQYTRYPPMDTRNGKVVIDSAAMSADNATYTDALYPTIIVAGAPGDIEVNPRSCNEEWEVNCSGNYGYGHFQVFNATHAHWNWFTTVPVAGSPVPDFSDDLWLVKTQ